MTTDFDNISALRKQGLSFREIGDTFDLHSEAVRGVYRRGMARLNRDLAAGGVGPALPLRPEGAPPAEGAGGLDPVLPTDDERSDRRGGPSSLHAELAAEPICKVCRYLAGLTPAAREEWQREMALTTTEVAHTAIVAALRRRAVSVGESSVKRHRRNHAAQ
jgi:hypothetical protein